MAFYTMAFLGTAPIGSLLAGVLADRIGAPTHDRCSAAWPASRRHLVRARGCRCCATLVRPIYIERGILPVPVVVDAGQKTL